MPLTRLIPLGLAIGYSALVLAIAPGQTDAFAALLAVYVRTMFPLWLLVGLIVLLVQIVVGGRAGKACRPGDIALGFLRDRWREDRFFSVLTPPLVASLLLSAYNLFKQFLLPSAGFGAGPIIGDIEHAMFGIDPWRITHALMSSPYATKAFDLAYHAWFLPMTLGVVACSFLRPGSPLALRYLFCYALLWIVQGTVLASLIPAAGPCFYEYFQFDTDRFRELTALLEQQDAMLRASGIGGLAAVEYQSILLGSYASHQPMLGNGISAMPSLHNAMAALFACAGMRIDRRLGWCCVAYAAVIWVGSIHLGWHYALDGIVAIPLTIGFWRLSALLWPDPAPQGQPLPGGARLAPA